MSTGPDIRVNPAFSIKREPIDANRHCLVIDDFLSNPQEVVTWARKQHDQFEFVERAYPGTVHPLDREQALPLRRFIRSSLSREFGFLRGDIKLQTQFSLTTLKPEEFSWVQRLPHSDPRLEAERHNFATVLYLFENPELGGTGFYRWKEPEFWQEMTSLQQSDPNAGLDTLQKKFRMFNEPPAYTAETNEAVELLAMIPAKFNRLIAYSGEVPHNAFITRPDLLVDDPDQGRLTLNTFASVWPAG